MTTLRSSLADDSTRDNTGDTVDGADVNANDYTIADAIDGTNEQAFNSAATPLMKFQNLPPTLDHKSGKIKVYNNTGGTLEVGDLVYVSGYNSGEDLYEVTKAIATADGSTTKYASLVMDEQVTNANSGNACQLRVLTAQDTSGLTASRPVYLDTTAGGWTGTLPAVENRIQIVGRVLVVDASAGRVELQPGAVIPWSIADQI